MKLYQIGDTSNWTSDGLFKTVKEAKQYIRDLVTEDVKLNKIRKVNVWENDFKIWELDSKWMMRRVYETIKIEEIKKSL